MDLVKKNGISIALVFMLYGAEVMHQLDKWLKTLGGQCQDDNFDDVRAF